MSGANAEVGKLAKFALAQTKVDDNKLDDAVALYQQLAAMDDPIVAKDTVNFELAKVYEKQGKKQEAADLYFNIAKAASEANDMDDKPIKMSVTAISAKEKLKAIDPDRAAQIELVSRASMRPLGEQVEQQAADAAQGVDEIARRIAARLREEGLASFLAAALQALDLQFRPLDLHLARRVEPALADEGDDPLQLEGVEPEPVPLAPVDDHARAAAEVPAVHQGAARRTAGGPVPF